MLDFPGDAWPAGAAARRLRVHVIAGPTGVGKTAVAERLARAYSSPIVVADRIQCFVDLEVTSARTAAGDEHGVRRHYLAQRWVRDGDLPARSAAKAFGYILGTLAAQHPFVVVEGGSISLLNEIFADDALPFDWSVDVRRIGARGQHRERLLQRAHEMLVPRNGGKGLLEELAAAWQVESQRPFVASVNGPEAVVEWCAQRGMDPARLRHAELPRHALDQLAEAIADAHLRHVEEQEEAFARLFGGPAVRRVATETLLLGDLRQAVAADPMPDAIRPPAPSAPASSSSSSSTGARPTVTVFCGARSGHSPVYRQQAVDLGRRLAQAGFDLVYGGAKIGCMGALADGALQAGGRVVGVMPQGLLEIELEHQGLTALHVVDSMHGRKALMAELADAFIALPGGLGTSEELLEMLTWRQLGLHRKPFLLLDVNGFWTHALGSLGHLVAAGFVDHEDVAHVRLWPDAASLVGALRALVPAAAG